MNNVLDRNNDYIKRISKLCLFDDDFMNIVFQNDKCVKLLLDIILDTDIRISDINIQHQLDNIKGRTVIMDMYIIDEKGRHINVEIQRDDSQAIAKRAGYHESLLKTNITSKQTKWKDISETYVIFITENDVLLGGLPIYHIERRIEENGERFEDGAHIIYVNGRNEEDTRLGRLMHDMRCTEVEDMYYEELREEARYYKEDEGGIEKMCKLFDEVEQRGIETGKREGILLGQQIGEQKGIEMTRIASIQSLMKNLNLSIEEAMEALSIPTYEYEQYTNLIN